MTPLAPGRRPSDFPRSAQICTTPAPVDPASHAAPGRKSRKFAQICPNPQPGNPERSPRPLRPFSRPPITLAPPALSTEPRLSSQLPAERQPIRPLFDHATYLFFLLLPFHPLTAISPLPAAPFPRARLLPCCRNRNSYGRIQASPSVRFKAARFIVEIATAPTPRTAQIPPECTKMHKPAGSPNRKPAQCRTHPSGSGQRNDPLPGAAFNLEKSPICTHPPGSPAGEMGEKPVMSRSWRYRFDVSLRRHASKAGAVSSARMDLRGRGEPPNCGRAI